MVKWLQRWLYTRGRRDLKKHYGNEYPDAVMILGTRMPLERETRFSRRYRSLDGRQTADVSKFEDGTAAMTVKQLRREWDEWPELDRQDFANECRWLFGQRDFPDMIRFMVERGNARVWSAIALPAARALPRNEAFKVLVGMLSKNEEHTANITQAIAATRHRDASRVLSNYLAELWKHPELWNDDPFNNWHALDSICCIEHLIELGNPASAFEEKARLLSQHVCAGTRQSCSTFLGKYYEFIPKPDLRRLEL